MQRKVKRNRLRVLYVNRRVCLRRNKTFPPPPPQSDSSPGARGGSKFRREEEGSVRLAALESPGEDDSEEDAIVGVATKGESAGRVEEERVGDCQSKKGRGGGERSDVSSSSSSCC